MSSRRDFLTLPGQNVITFLLFSCPSRSSFVELIGFLVDVDRLNTDKAELKESQTVLTSAQADLQTQLQQTTAQFNQLKEEKAQLHKQQSVRFPSVLLGPRPTCPTGNMLFLLEGAAFLK